MPRTPPVAVSLQRQPAVQACVALIAALAVGGLALSVHNHHPQALAWFWAVIPATAWAWRAAAVLPRRLRWDGEMWWLTEPGQDAEVPVQLRVVIDLDQWMLLATHPKPRWLPLSRQQQAAHWGALRATLLAARGGSAHR